MIGRNVTISTDPFRRICIPMGTRFGEVTISIGLNETPDAPVPAHLEAPFPGRL